MKKIWKISKDHKKILDDLFDRLDNNKIKSVLDIGSGKTSLDYLTKRFPKIMVQGVIHPGDKNKIESIEEHVKSDNYFLNKINFLNFKQKVKFDLVLVHLFLGEAGRFTDYRKIFNKLTKIRTKYMIIVDILDDPEVNYSEILKFIGKNEVMDVNYHEAQIITRSKKKFNGYIGFLIRLK